MLSCMLMRFAAVTRMLLQNYNHQYNPLTSYHTSASNEFFMKKSFDAVAWPRIILIYIQPSTGLKIAKHVRKFEFRGLPWSIHLKKILREAISTLKLKTVAGHGETSTIDVRKATMPVIDVKDNFDPWDHRAPQNEIKVWMAYFNVLRTMFGAGMLAMPLGISQMGYILGPIMTFATGLLIIFTHNMLLNSLYEVSRQLKIPYISYRYGFRIALYHGPPALHSIAERGPCIIAIFMMANQLGLCTVFVIFTTDCFRDLADWQSSEPALLSLFVPYLIMEYFMKDLRIISYISMSGNFLNLLGLGFVFLRLYLDDNGEKMSYETNILAVQFAFGLLMFNLSNVGVILSIDKSLKKPSVLTSKFGILNVGILCPTTVAVVFGMLGYYAFGTMEENILRSLPYDRPTSMTAIGLYLIAVGFAYPIQCYPGITTLVEVIKYHDVHQEPSAESLKLIETIGRPIFVTLSFLIAYMVPFQGPLVAFVGNLCTTMLQLVFPALMDISLRYPHNYGKNNIRLIADLLILFLGLVSFSFGVYKSAYLIHIRILSKASPNNKGFF